MMNFKENMSVPVFSIIMPVYNAEKTLEKSLSSILRQTFKEYEVIAINDGSGDNSLEILKHFSNRFDTMKIIDQENSGPGKARNRGILEARGEYVAFLDADDYWSDDFLEEVLKASDNHSADYIYVEMVKETSQGRVIARTNVARNRGITKEQMICRQMTGQMPWGMSKVIRRQILVESGSAFAELSVGEENIFSFEALKASKKIAFVDKIIYHYVQNQDGQHRKGSMDPWNKLVMSFKEHLIDSNEYGKYETTINSLALKAMSICIYRCALNYSPNEAKREINNCYMRYCREYDFSKINKDALNKSTLIIYYITKLHLDWILILLSRLRCAICG